MYHLPSKETQASSFLVTSFSPSATYQYCSLPVPLLKNIKRKIRKRKQTSAATTKLTKSYSNKELAFFVGKQTTDK
jgi:hypothetical protein